MATAFQTNAFQTTGTTAKMKSIVVIFLILQLLDGITTAIGLRFGFVELNPLEWDVLIPLKIIGAVGVAVVLRYKKPSRLDKWVVIVSSLPVAWNLLNLVLL